MRERYNEVYQRPLGFTVPLYFALGWVAEKFGPEIVDWATFACWKSNNHYGPFEEISEREERLAKEDITTATREGKGRGRPSQGRRSKQKLSTEVDALESTLSEATPGIFAHYKDPHCARRLTV